MAGCLGNECAACFGLLQQQPNGVGASLLPQSTAGSGRKGQKIFLWGSKEKEKPSSRICRPCLPIKVGMLLVALASAALLVIILTGFIGSINPTESPRASELSPYPRESQAIAIVPPDRFRLQKKNGNEEHNHRSHYPVGSHSLPLKHPCKGISFPPPLSNPKRTGPRPCPVCYAPVEYAIALMPDAPSASPVIKSLSYGSGDYSSTYESNGGTRFGGHPSLQQRNESFDIKESMFVHCGFFGRNRPGNGTGFEIEPAVLLEMEQCHGVVVASAIFGNYDVLQQPQNVSDAAKLSICFYMFMDEETKSYVKSSSEFDSLERVGLWRVVTVRNLPYSDPRRNGKIPKLLLHRIFPNARFSLWIDGKLELVVDPYQILERFLWRRNATFAISRHYRRFDVFDEAEANKAAGKYDNTSIDRQINFYKSEGLMHYSPSKLPITSDVPEGCVIIREHTPLSNLFSCLWFNEVDRFTSRDQLSFSTVRDKIRSKVNWTVEMFMDCERRNFVVQGYHRDVLEQKRSSQRLGNPPLEKLEG